MSSNPRNVLVLTGRISQDIKTFPNRDGSKKIIATLAVEDDFVSGPDRKAQTNFIDIQAFIGKDVKGNGGWDLTGKGDLVTVAARVVSKPYEKDGKTVYPGNTIEATGFPQFLESKATTQARAARNAVASTPSVSTEPSEGDTAEVAALKAQLAAATAGPSVTDPATTTPFSG